MSGSRFDEGIWPPEDVGAFLPRPDFFAAVYRLSAHNDLMIRYYAAEQFIALMIGSIPPSEAAVNAVELVDYILMSGRVRDGVGEFLSGSFSFPEEVEDWDQFGDGGRTAGLILEVVCLPKVADRAAILSALALHAVEGAEVPEPHIGHIRRFLLGARGELAIRRVT
ncbi:hypothetical protein [Brevundimonas sp.]|uniref:hypothetical protein n=1 Tax=Brevundimonas sp. TaxID=1871086 RepID=UPI001DD755F5|nr:hypothetical protein [Brevundimonas sp.]MBL0946832.1 hypothetical protein [Brevundimonas sp.]